jgi:hypothetical protein
LIQLGAKLVNRKTCTAFEQAEDRFHDFRRRERRADEVVRNLVVFASVQEDSVSAFDGAAGPADLLVIGHHRAGSLKMDHEAEVRLVETHA